MVRRLILDSLRYWVGHMHVDGFRFDLASVLSRDESGCPLQRPPILWDIQSDPVLAGTKLIAEAWDAAGLYQVGSFAGDAWQEWNGKFRDDVRRFVKSDNDTVVAFGYRCFGSPDIYGHEERGPEQSVNFVTSHDGFTLNDLVSYNAKHNEANGEGGRDGSDANLSWNCGVEGPTVDPDDRAAAPAPGEELPGDHAAVARHADAADGRRGPADAARQQQRVLPGQRDQLVRLDAPRATPRSAPLREDAGPPAAGCSATELGSHGVSLNELLREADIQPHGITLNHPDLRPDSHSLAVTVRATRAAVTLHVMFNAYWEPLTFELPRRVVATMDRHVPRGARRRERRRRAARRGLDLHGAGAVARRAGRAGRRRRARAPAERPAERRRRVPVTTPPR